MAETKNGAGQVAATPDVEDIRLRVMEVLDDAMKPLSADARDELRRSLIATLEVERGE